MLHQSVGALIAGGIYTVLLAIAAVSDFRLHRIPNRVVAPLAAAGLAYALVSRSVTGAVVFAGLGAAVGLLVWLPLALLRWLEPGDVKLMAAVGTWLGVGGVLRASLAGAIAAGSLAVAMLLWRHSSRDASSRMILLVNTIRRKPAGLLVPRSALVAANERALPYGAALVVGALAAGWLSSTF